MNQDLNFFKTTMSNSRMADYHLGCLEGSVFIDLNLSDNSQIYLKRISFDGYGCCELRNFDHNLNLEESDDIIAQMKLESLDQHLITALIKKLIYMNKEELWTDALQEYNLI